MEEKIIGLVNAESKPEGGLLVKSCELAITNKRIIVNFTGNSAATMAMVGGLINKSSGAMGFGIDAKSKSDKKKLKGNDFKKLLLIRGNHSIDYNNIDPNKSSFKTGFFSTFGMYASLIIKSLDGKNYFFKVYNNEKELAKNYINSATDKIKF